MQRCASLLVAGLLSLACVAASARNFPADALRGELKVLQPPAVELNGKAARLAPGARIRGTNNLSVVSAQIAGQKLVVHYTLDIHGLVQDVWVLTADEAAVKPWPRSAEQAKSWVFDPVGQRWSER